MNDIEVLIRLILAIPLGGMIGYEREIQNQPAGLRTHIVLCVGSTLMMLISIYISTEVGTSRFADPSRIAAQVVTGIGFLGAGAIMRLGVSVKGLTTAASLWATAGIGLAIGCGFYSAAIITTIIILVALNSLKKWPKFIFQNRPSQSIIIEARESSTIIGKIEQVMTLADVEISSIQVYKNPNNKSLEIQVDIEKKEGTNMFDITNKLISDSEIIDIEIQ